jgi:hypothetical protein
MTYDLPAFILPLGSALCDNTAINLSAIASGIGGFVINGKNLDDENGTSVSTAGDVNGDGLAYTTGNGR